MQALQPMQRTTSCDRPSRALRGRSGSVISARVIPHARRRRRVAIRRVGLAQGRRSASSRSAASPTRNARREVGDRVPRRRRRRHDPRRSRRRSTSRRCATLRRSRRRRERACATTPRAALGVRREPDADARGPGAAVRTAREHRDEEARGSSPIGRRAGSGRGRRTARRGSCARPRSRRRRARLGRERRRSAP